MFIRPQRPGGALAQTLDERHRGFVPARSEVSVPVAIEAVTTTRARRQLAHNDALELS